MFFGSKKKCGCTKAAAKPAAKKAPAKKVAKKPAAKKSCKEKIITCNCVIYPQNL